VIIPEKERESFHLELLIQTKPFPFQIF